MNRSVAGSPGELSVLTTIAGEFRQANPCGQLCVGSHERVYCPGPGQSGGVSWSFWSAIVLATMLTQKCAWRLSFLSPIAATGERRHNGPGLKRNSNVVDRGRASVLIRQSAGPNKPFSLYSTTCWCKPRSLPRDELTGNSDGADCLLAHSSRPATHDLDCKTCDCPLDSDVKLWCIIGRGRQGERLYRQPVGKDGRGQCADTASL